MSLLLEITEGETEGGERVAGTLTTDGSTHEGGDSLETTESAS